jgi:hypothetical protein
MFRASIGILIGLLATGGAQAAPAELSTPERAAAFRAAGFKHWSSGWTRCEDDITASFQPATLEVVDLNGDGVLEAWIRESSLFCYGATAEAFVLLTRRKSGWTVILDQVGTPLELNTGRLGWPDIEVGGPGLGAHPVYRFNGSKYVRK